MKNRHWLCALLPAALLLGCQGTKLDDKAVRSAIEARNKELGALVAKGDAAGIAAMYTGDGTLMPPNMPTVKGRADIEAMWKGMLASGVKGLELTAGEVLSQGHVASEIGTYKVLVGDGQVVDKGKYIVVWGNDEGKWFLHRDIWNSDNPPPPPPPAQPAPAAATEPPVH